MKLRPFIALASLAATLALTANLHAVTVPFTETFETSAANWVNFNSSQFLTHSPSGGFDGGGYASGTLSFEGRAVGATPITLRGRNVENASNGNFIGDWATAGAQQINAFVRHDAPAPLDFFFRAAGPQNFPGAIFQSDVTVSPGEWTRIVFDISSDSPQVVSFEGSSWDTIFSNIGHVQFGVFVPDGLSADTTLYNFDLDNATVTNVPEPTTLAAATVFFAFIAFARRRSR